MPTTSSTRDRDLATLRLPTISRLNQQIRQECMGYLFESRAFDLCVGTNIRHRRVAQCSYSRWPPVFDQVADCGTLGLNPTVRSFLKRAGKWALFKDVSFHIFESFKIPRVRYTKVKLVFKNEVEFNREKLALAVVRLRVEQDGKLSIVSEKKGKEDDEELDRTLQDVKEVAEAVASRKSFKGLTTADLHKIAKTLYGKP